MILIFNLWSIIQADQPFWNLIPHPQTRIWSLGLWWWWAWEAREPCSSFGWWRSSRDTDWTTTRMSSDVMDEQKWASSSFLLMQALAQQSEEEVESGAVIDGSPFQKGLYYSQARQIMVRTDLEGLSLPFSPSTLGWLLRLHVNRSLDVRGWWGWCFFFWTDADWFFRSIRSWKHDLDWYWLLVRLPSTWSGLVKAYFEIGWMMLEAVDANVWGWWRCDWVTEWDLIQ